MHDEVWWLCAAKQCDCWLLPGSQWIRWILKWSMLNIPVTFSIDHFPAIGLQKQSGVCKCKFLEFFMIPDGIIKEWNIGCCIFICICICLPVCPWLFLWTRYTGNVTCLFVFILENYNMPFYNCVSVHIHTFSAKNLSIHYYVYKNHIQDIPKEMLSFLLHFFPPINAW